MVVVRGVGSLRAGLLACAVVLACASAPAPARAGVAADSAGVYSEELERTNSLNTVAVGLAQHAAGAGLVRQPFSWARIETVPGHLDFAAYDEVMAAAAIARLSVLPVVMDPPRWRSTQTAGSRAAGMYPPREPGDMAMLLAALVYRYGPSGTFWAAHPELPPSPIHAWQVWNEPNIRAFWATGPDPAAYVRLLAAAGTAIRAVDPSAEVVAAGLPHTGSGMPMAQFIDGMYAAGARGTFDTLAIHPYASDPAAVLDVLETVRAQVDRLGDPTRPIWATEFGWATGGPEVTLTTSEAVQAKWLRETVVLMQRRRSALRLRGFVVFRWRDVGLNAGQTDIWALNTGLLRRDGSPKPALAAYSDAVAIWRAEPTAAQAAAATAAAEARAAQHPIQRAGQVAGVSRRKLRMRYSIARGRLVVRVDVPPGGGEARARISYVATRDGRVVVRRARRVTVRAGRSRAVFKLPSGARSAQRLRVTARQGDAQVTRRVACVKGARNRCSR